MRHFDDGGAAYSKLHAWIEKKVNEQTGTKVFRVQDLCRNKPKDEFIALVKAYIKMNGGKHIELNNSYSKVRIYGKKQSIFELMR
jgi:hypothetical protein